MAVRLFVGNLAYDVTEAELRTLFAGAGSPSSVRIPTDRETGKPRGFAFVEFNDRAEAEEAVRRFHQQVFKGRPLAVNEARPRGEGPPPGSRDAHAPRPAAPDRVSWSEPGAADAPSLPSAPRRTFGPDAPPRGKRKHKGKAPTGERVPKGPLRERSGGQFFSGDVDDGSTDDAESDDFSVWAREKDQDD